MTEKNEIDTIVLSEIVARDIWSKGEIELVDELYSDEFVGEVIGFDSFHGPGDYKAWVSDSRVAFPDLDVEIDELIEADELLCGKWTARGTHEGKIKMLDLEPTGESVEYSGLFIAHIHDEQVVRELHCSDFVTLLGQVGILPESAHG